MVIIKKSNIHGKGVFATKDIAKDYILECDILEVTKSDILYKYLYPFIGNRVCVHIGFASFLNSSSSPNIMHFKIDTNNMISYFKVLNDIKKGEELTLNYM